MRAVRFADITPGRRKTPSWVAPPRGDAGVQVVTLRPPRVPSGLEPAGGELEGADPDVSEMRLAAAVEAPPTAPQAEPAPAAPVAERRSDTFIDEIAPAVDDEALATLTRAVREITTLRDEIFATTEQQLVELVGLVVRRVVAREVSVNPRLLRGLVREGLEALGAHDRVAVRIGPGFADVRRELETELSQEGTHCAVSVDASLDRFACIVQTELGQVDESVESRLSALLDALASGGHRG